MVVLCGGWCGEPELAKLQQIARALGMSSRAAAMTSAAGNVCTDRHSSGKAPASLKALSPPPNELIICNISSETFYRPHKVAPCIHIVYTTNSYP